MSTNPNKQAEELRFRDKYGVQALDRNQPLDRLSAFGVASGGKVTSAGDPYQLSVSPCTAQFGYDTDGTPNEISFGSNAHDVLQYVDDNDPRKILICVGSDGKHHIEAGDPDPIVPEGVIAQNAQQSGSGSGSGGSVVPGYFQTERPAPPDLYHRTDRIVLASVWLGANATKVEPEHIRRRRVWIDIEVGDIRAREITLDTLVDGAGVAHSNELADRTDIPTTSEIRHAIDTDPNHGVRGPGGAQHDFYTDNDALSIVNAQDVLSVSISGNADTLDGRHGNEYSLVTHNHDKRYIEDNKATVTPYNLSFDPFTQKEYQETLSKEVSRKAFILKGGQNPAAVVTASNISAPIESDFEVDVVLTSDPGFNAGYSYEWERVWDDSSGTWTVEATITWSDTPNNGQDANGELRVAETAETAKPLTVNGEAISPASVTTQTVHTDELLVSQQFTIPAVQTEQDLPNGMPAGTKFIVQSESRQYFEDGT